MLSLLRTLLAPPSCSGCGAPGPEWCAECASVLPRPCWRDVGVRVRAEYEFAGPIRRTIIDWKDEQQRTARDRVVNWFREGLTPMLEATPDAVIVPVPASPLSLRRRGAGVLHEAVIDAVAGAQVEGWLISQRNRQDQSELGRDARSLNLQGSMQWVGPRNRHIILVDDVITTGATLRESVRAMRVSGAAPTIGFVIAHRERRAPVAVRAAGLRLP